MPLCFYVSVFGHRGNTAITHADHDVAFGGGACLATWGFGIGLHGWTEDTLVLGVVS